ncbi:ABC transporter permease subunit [Alicyclobacillus fastidiosus]|uniref:ABC transporter permease subunit n=1 Tax=Alicyclobacillus fastidiosus TaxID=392011 RepID=A0ABV5ACQ3_9BACL|nr:ABC transporter permease subunit [Alicyclobacillus fastidiosus]WEH10416.1 ABC transporter permease subunit [Alicyclobacillus fastidiosus]
MVRKIGALGFETFIGGLLVLFFAGFGVTSTFVGAIHEAVALVVQTVDGEHLRANYAGVTGVEVWTSFRLIAVATALSFLGGLAHAVWNIRIRHRLAQHMNEFAATLLQTVPEAMYVVLVFVVLVYLLNHGINVPGLFHDGIPRWQDTFAPAIALAIPGALYLRSIVYNRLKDELEAQYVSTAVAKGLSWRRIFYVHVLPNSLPMAFLQIPVVAGFVISSALFAEYFLGYMGLLSRLTTFVGWDMTLGSFSLRKANGIPTYQGGAVAVVGLLLLASWLVFAVIGEVLAARFPSEIEPSPTPTQRKVDKPWLIAGSLLIAVVLFFSAFPRLLTKNSPNAVHEMNTQAWTYPPFAPSRTYLLGTDSAGRDLLSQTLHGTFTTLSQVVIATVIVVIGSIVVASVAVLERGWVSQLLLRFGRTLSTAPVLFIVFLAVYHRNLSSPYQAIQFIAWIAFFEIGRGAVSFYSALVEWHRFGFIEGAKSVGQRRISIVFRQLRSWLGQFTLEFTFAEFTRVLSLMTLLAMLHTYAVDKLVALNGMPPAMAERSGQLTWFSTLGDAANDVFSIISHPFTIYAPCLALAITMIGASFLARGFRGSR